VSNKEQFLTDVDQLASSGETLLQLVSTLLLGRHSQDDLSVLSPLMLSLLRQLDRVVTETAGCDIYISRFATALEKLFAKVPENF
jgi:hypothetical protein